MCDSEAVQKVNEHPLCPVKECIVNIIETTSRRASRLTAYVQVQEGELSRTGRFIETLSVTLGDH